MQKQHTNMFRLMLVLAHLLGFAIVGCLIYTVWHFLPIIVNLLPIKIINAFEIVLIVVFILLKIICILISVAYFTIAERKIMASIQRRKGPDVVGLFGLLQPLADGLKLLVKQLLLPTKANLFIFLFAPILILTLSLIS